MARPRYVYQTAGYDLVADGVLVRTVKFPAERPLPEMGAAGGMEAWLKAMAALSRETAAAQTGGC